MITKTLTACAVGIAVAALVPLAVPAPAQASELQKCASTDEADAFRLRHLQSRLMVAALACNQQAAYNTFVEHFRPRLTAAGADIVGYFKRAGGEAALNRHITALANAAGLSRAEDPEAYCAETWTMFFLLEDDPMDLPVVAAAHALPAVAQPVRCDVPTSVQAQSADAAPPIDGAVAATIPAAQ